MSNAGSMVLLGVFPIAEAKRLKAALEAQDVRLEMRHDPASCSSGGCAPTVELLAPGGRLDEVRAFLLRERERDLGGLVPGEHCDAVFDPERAVATCPACGVEFATDCAECPSCGLGFGIG